MDSTPSVKDRFMAQMKAHADATKEIYGAAMKRDKAAQDAAMAKINAAKAAMKSLKAKAHAAKKA